MDFNKCWIDTEAITKEEYEQLFELVLKLQNRIKTKTNRAEGTLKDMLPELRNQLIRNECRFFS